jgi:hypothetical protein
MAGVSLRSLVGLRTAAKVKNLVFRRDYYRQAAMELEASKLPMLQKQAAIRKLQKQITDVENKIGKLTARAKHPGFDGLGERSYYAPHPQDDPFNLPGLAHLAAEATAEDVEVQPEQTDGEQLTDIQKAAFKRTAIIGGSIIAALALLR